MIDKPLVIIINLQSTGRQGLVYINRNLPPSSLGELQIPRDAEVLKSNYFSSII
ncbi:hypothetical protein BDV39DRAFT_79066 [Aspergillus sergii]|uniref:Uncharacterized protein n=1 Tax=Aspergillus sergii TaxID=1034303 RepID=A0A5N6X404_9EURO|nr:hypothetical protein BDV39DRAFT_79066 [Aspergillus sergii]